MNADIEFYFDFSSPYGYLASFQIDDLAARHGRDVNWRPMMLGIAMKQTGSQPLAAIPIKGDYSRHDIERTARRLNIPFVFPNPFPIMTLAAARAFYWINGDDPVCGRTFAKATYQKYFGEGQDISTSASVVEIAGQFGVDRELLLSALKEPALKERLKTETNAAVERGVFGSPFFIINDEPFWGADRLYDIERWLETGGW